MCQWVAQIRAAAVAPSARGGDDDQGSVLDCNVRRRIRRRAWIRRVERPLGANAEERLHRWMFEQAEANVAELESLIGAGAYVMGRNMFAPGRGEWDLEWKGWSETRAAVPRRRVRTPHHAAEIHSPWTVGTTFTFVTDGIEAALDQAAAAGDGYVAIPRGAETVNQYLACWNDRRTLVTRRTGPARAPASACSTPSRSPTWRRSGRGRHRPRHAPPISHPPLTLRFRSQVRQ